jgi:hypothetical protein
MENRLMKEQVLSLEMKRREERGVEEKGEEEEEKRRRRRKMENSSPSLDSLLNSYVLLDLNPASIPVEKKEEGK